LGTKRKAQNDTDSLRVNLQEESTKPETNKKTEKTQKERTLHKKTNDNSDSDQISESSKISRDETEWETHLLTKIDEITKVKEVQNTALKMGYNEEDYIYQRVDKPNCIHEFIAPKDWQRAQKFVRPEKLAKEYKFTLDTFQDKAVECIMKNESVLVAAHTSAGKTAIAEYAIA